MISSKSILRLASPPYLFQPQQAVKRLWREYFWRAEAQRTVRLPWGLCISINPQDELSRAIASHGLYELAVTETLWKLTDKSDLVVDAGANIGYMTSVLAVASGRAGKVVSFEPHPAMFETLRANVGAWATDKRCAAIVIHEVALGDRNGKATLRVNEKFSENNGIAYVYTGEETNPGDLQVTMRTLDSVIDEERTIGVLKIDVQGFEMSVLTGSMRLLKSRAIRDIVFEEEGAFPAATHKFLQTFGYAIFGIEQTLTGVRLSDSVTQSSSPAYAPPNYLATLEPNRAKQRLIGKFWSSFGPARIWRAYR